MKKIAVIGLLVCTCIFALVHDLFAQEKPKPGDYIGLVTGMDWDNVVSLAGLVQSVKGDKISFTGLLDNQEYQLSYTFKEKWGFKTYEGMLINDKVSKFKKGETISVEFYRPDFSKVYEGQGINKLFEKFRKPNEFITMSEAIGWAIAEFPDGLRVPVYIQQLDDRNYNVAILTLDKNFKFDAKTMTIKKSYLPQYKPGTKLKFYAVTVLTGKN